MAMPTATELFDVADAKIWQMTTDDVGGTTTYGAGIDVPGINNITCEPEFISAVLKGDSKTLATRARVDSFSFGVGYSLLSLDVLAVLYAATVTPETSGGYRSMEISGGGSLPYFMLGVQILDAADGIGAVNLYGFKCKVSGGSLVDQSTESYGGRNFQCTAIPTLATNKMFRLRMHPTPTALTTS